jgi:hypothetical protein
MKVAERYYTVVHIVKSSRTKAERYQMIGRQMCSDPNWRSSGLNAPLVEILNKEKCRADTLADEQRALNWSLARIPFSCRRGHCLIDQLAEFQPGASCSGSCGL